MQPSWLSRGTAAAALALAACGTLPPSPVATEIFQKREQAIHIALSWNCRPAEGGGVVIEGVVEDTNRGYPIRGLRFTASAYDKDGRRLTHVVGYPDGLRIGYQGWTRFRVLVPRGDTAARVDLAYEYFMQTGNGERPISLHRPLLFQFAAIEEYFATIPDACRS